MNINFIFNLLIYYNWNLVKTLITSLVVNEIWRLPQYLISYVVHHDGQFFVQQAIVFLYKRFAFFEAVPRLGVLLRNSWFLPDLSSLDKWRSFFSSIAVGWIPYSITKSKLIIYLHNSLRNLSDLNFDIQKKA